VWTIRSFIAEKHSGTKRRRSQSNWSDILDTSIVWESTTSMLIAVRQGGRLSGRLRPLFKECEQFFVDLIF
jgi:hypothetical protein